MPVGEHAPDSRRVVDIVVAFFVEAEEVQARGEQHDCDEGEPRQWPCGHEMRHNGYTAQYGYHGAYTAKATLIGDRLQLQDYAPYPQL